MSYKQRLDHLFGKVAALSCDLELQAHWARYLCVLTSGFLEVSVSAIYTEYARSNTQPRIANFVSSQLRRFPNPKMNRIIELARQFSGEWADRLQRDTDGALKDAVDSIVDNRNAIAHGGNIGITYHRIRDYYARALRVVELIDRQCS